MPGERTPRVGVIIPARYESSRFPGKPLARLRGADGVERPLIEHSWRAAAAVEAIESIWVATDDERIADEVRRFGGAVVMTPADCANGTERCAAALASVENAPEIVVNLQGDAPLTPAAAVTALITRLAKEPALPVATVAVQCTSAMYRHLVEDQANGRVGGTTVVFDRDGNALYFSKRILPYVSDAHASEGTPPVFLHLGVYAYRRDALALYAASPCTDLEQMEGLEQLRFLYSGVRVGVVACEPPSWDLIELNNPSDVAPVEAGLQRRGVF